MKLSGILATSVNNVIGVGDRLPWRIKSELAYFKEVTTGKVLIVGNSTYKTLPKLSDRTVIVLMSAPQEYKHGNEIHVYSVQEALVAAAEECKKIGCDEVMVIGGKSVYRQFEPAIDRWYLTRVATYVPLAVDNIVYNLTFSFEDWDKVSTVSVPETEESPSYAKHIYERRMQDA